ncbi:polymorphic toxin-type HINT domain-containing protein [Solihabitans fulvus]|uniref:polymorphic toxin-type HINT domain-containing protein n=1 Tax=Solihabitans fulvus TaxID=1892852 RepID=UPI001661C8C4|nr:polymorphic toxin-type HINT domain-containing protein [Solihabitans fulvus]
MSKDTATSWPDVPVDQICAQGTNCTNTAPAFFTRKRLTVITSQVTNGSGGWNSVNQWSLNHTFPNTGDGSSPALWLASVTHTGLAGGSIALPATTFNGTTMANRVDATSNYTAITRNRITSVVNEMGGVTAINYSAPECVPGTTMPANPESNQLRCFPTYWTPGGATAPVLDWFNKYVVTDVTDDGRTSLSPQVRTHYDYLGGGAWHYDENLLGDPQYRTWSQWRGYGTVRTTKGQPSGDPSGPQTVTQALYLRGMDGDTLPNGGTRSASVTNALNEQIPDSKQLVGYTRESLTYFGTQIIAATVDDPWMSAATGTDSNGIGSFLTGTSAIRSRVWLAASGTWRNTRSTNAFNGQGLLTQTEDDGDVADPSQATCTRYTYAQNPTAWLLTYRSKVEKISGTCANTASSTTIVAQSLAYFDGATDLASQQPSKGDVTQAQTIDTWPAAGGPTYLTGSSGYDLYGRATSVTDTLGRTTTTAYTPTTGGPVTQIAVTTPQISASNTTKLTSTKTLDPVSGALVTAVDGSGLRTEATYDALGRLSAVWKPGQNKVQNWPANTTYSYTVNTGSPSVVASSTLLSHGDYATSYALVDGLGRTVQAQAPTPYAQGGRLVTDTLFDTQGRTWKTHSPYWNNDSGPSGTLLVVQDNAVPNTTVASFDGAGRAIASAYQLYGTEQWRTTTTYDGDRVTTVPPTGGTAITVVSNGLKQKTQTVQYKDPTQTGPSAAADVTSYTYLPSGLPATVTDPTGKNVWSYTYDLQGRKASSTDPDSGTSTFSYDNAGQLLATTDARGKSVAYTHDNLGRKTAEFDGSTTGTKLAAWNYDTVVKGLPTNSVRYIGGKPYINAVTAYDTAGRPTNTRVTIPLSETGLGGSYQFATGYDQYTGWVNTTDSPQAGGLSGETIYQDRDRLGNPTVLTAVDTAKATKLVSETDYNPYGQVLRTNYQSATDPNQVSVTSTYADGTNRLAGTLAVRATSSNYVIGNKAYAYDAAGDITSIADTPLAGTADTQCFGQDYLQRLTQAWTPASGDCTVAPTAAGLGGAAPYWTSWTFDQTGNRRTQVQHATAGDTTNTSAYPQPGQPQPHTLQSVATAGPTGTGQSTYTYDPAGNTLTRTLPSGGQTYTYDSEGHVATATDATGKVSTYVYDADGTRLLTKDPTGSTLSIGDVELFVAAGTTTAVGTRFYTHNGKPVAERNANTGLKWLLTDHQNTTYASVDAGNLAVTQRRQDPYGNPRGTAPSNWPDQHGYLGGYQNTTGLTHLGARDYDPIIGRFTQVDPVLDTASPQQMNGYAYSNNTPVIASDPSGLLVNAGPDGAWYPGIAHGVGTTSINDAGGSPERQGISAAGPSDVNTHPHGTVSIDHGGDGQYINDVRIPKFGPDFGQLAARIDAWTQAWKKERFNDENYDISDNLSSYTQDLIYSYCENHRSFCGGDYTDKLSFWHDAGVGWGADSPHHGVSVQNSGQGSPGVARGSEGCNSFAAGTPVLMVDGNSKPIQDVAVGDTITNSEPDSEVVERHAVTEIHITDDDRAFVDLTIAAGADNRSITSTAHHLFYSATMHAWVDVEDVKVGDQLETPGNGRATVTASRHYVAAIRTYNLTVDDVHTFYVLAGSSAVLVHNCAKNAPKAPQSTPNVIHDGVNKILNNERAQRTNPDGTLDFYEGRASTPAAVARKWVGARIYDIPGGGNRYRVLINGYGDVGWIDNHNYDKVFAYQPR